MTNGEQPSTSAVPNACTSSTMGEGLAAPLLAHEDVPALEWAEAAVEAALGPEQRSSLTMAHTRLDTQRASTPRMSARVVPACACAI